MMKYACFWQFPLNIFHCSSPSDSLGFQIKEYRVEYRVDESRQVSRLHASSLKSMGNPSILYNNAGTTLSKYGLTSIDKVSIEDFEYTMARQLRLCLLAN